MGLGSNHMTTTTGDNFRPEIWSKELQVATEANLVAGKLVKRFDAEMKSKGDVLHIPKITELSATEKQAETEVTFSSPTEGKIDLSIDKHYHIAFLIEDILDAQSAYMLANEYKNKVVYGLSKQVDTDLLALQSGLSQSVGTAATPLQDENILRAIQYLDDADAPMERRSFVMKPQTKNELLQVDRYVNNDFVGDKPVGNGLFGQRYGVAFYVSTNVPVDGSSNPINLLFQEEALALAIQKNIQLESGRILEHLSTGYVGQVLYGVTEYRDDHAVKVLN